MSYTQFVAEKIIGRLEKEGLVGRGMAAAKKRGRPKGSYGVKRVEVERSKQDSSLEELKREWAQRQAMIDATFKKSA